MSVQGRCEIDIEIRYVYQEFEPGKRPRKVEDRCKIIGVQDTFRLTLGESVLSGCTTLEEFCACESTKPSHHDVCQ